MTMCSACEAERATTHIEEYELDDVTGELVDTGVAEPLCQHCFDDICDVDETELHSWDELKEWVETQPLPEWL